MRFFWKVFFSTILVSVVTFSVGAYFLVDSQFRTSVSREVSAVYEENEILCHTFLANLQDPPFTYDAPTSVTTSPQLTELFRRAARSVTIQTSKGTVPFRFSDMAGNPIFDGSGLAIGSEMLTHLSAHTRGHQIIRLDRQYFLHAASPLSVQNETFYLENFRDITALYENRDNQYLIFTRLIFAMILISGLVVIFLSRWLTKPLKLLSSAVQEIADGNLEQRVEIHSDDEIGQLSADFNSMAARLEQMVGELKENARRQEDFVGSFAHELKTPLTSIMGYADMLRSKRMSQEEAVLSANYIFEEGKRLEALSMKLLDLIVLKKRDFKFRQISAQDLFCAVENALEPQMDRENVNLYHRAESALLLVEPDLMKTVCVNLLDNARKAMEHGGEIHMIGSWQGDCYQIEVTDTGKGMDPAELSKITEAFYMVDKSRARAQGGAGLGLAICAEILKLHQAALRFESKPGHGTKATITLKGAKPL